MLATMRSIYCSNGVIEWPLLHSMENHQFYSCRSNHRSWLFGATPYSPVQSNYYENNGNASTATPFKIGWRKKMTRTKCMRDNRARSHFNFWLDHIRKNQKFQFFIGCFFSAVADRFTWSYGSRLHRTNHYTWFQKCRACRCNAPVTDRSEREIGFTNLCLCGSSIIRAVHFSTRFAVILRRHDEIDTNGWRVVK